MQVKRKAVNRGEFGVGCALLLCAVVGLAEGQAFISLVCGIAAVITFGNVLRELL